MGLQRITWHLRWCVAGLTDMLFVIKLTMNGNDNLSTLHTNPIAKDRSEIPKKLSEI